MFKSQKFKPVFIFVILLGLIALGYSYYFLVYVVQNQQAIDIRSFRRLEAINSVIDNRLEQFYIKFSQEPENNQNLNQLNNQISNLAKDLATEQSFLIKKRSSSKNKSEDRQQVDPVSDTSKVGFSQQEEIIIAKAEQIKKQANKKKQIQASIWIKESTAEKYAITDRAAMLEKDGSLELDISEEFYISMGFGDHSWNYASSLFFNELAFADYFDELAVIYLDKDVSAIYQSANFGTELSEDLFKNNASATFLYSYNGIQYKGYFQHLPIDNTMVIGLKSVLSIQAEAESIDQYLIIFLFILLVVSVIAYPFLKLIFLGKNDRLKITDLYVLGITTILGFAVILNIYFIFVYHNENIGPRTDNDLNILSEEISESIQANITQLNQKLDVFNSKVFSTDGVDLKDTLVLGKDKTEYFDSAQINQFPESYYVINDQEQAPKILLFLDPAFDGTQQFPIQDRSYYTDILHGNFKHLDGNDFSIESIYSWSSNNPEVVITKLLIGPDSTRYVSAIATEQFSSTFDRLLPFGYQFMVVDKTGEVILHSNKYLNRRENIFDEIGNKDKLRDVITTEEDLLTTIDYHQVEHSAKVLPLHGLDWSLIVVKDNSLDKFEELSIFYYSLLVSGIWFVVIMVITLVLKATAYRSKSLKKNVFAYFWLLPSHQGQKYVIKTFINVGLILLQVALFYQIENIVIAFQSHIAVIILTGLSNFLILYPNSDQHMKDLLRDPTFIKFSGIQLFLFGINLYFLFGFDAGIGGLLLSASAITIIISLSNIQFPLFENLIDRLGFSSSRSYQNFLFTWLILIVLIPSTLYFKIISHEDEKSWIQASMITDKLMIQDNAFNEKIDPVVYVHQKVYGKQLYPIEFSNACDSTDNTTAIDSLQKSLFSASRLYTSMFFSDQAKIPYGKSYGSVDNENFEFKNVGDTLYTLCANMYESSSDPRAINISYRPMKPHGLGLLFTSPLAIILILIVVYNLIKLISFKALNAGLISTLIRQEREEILTMNVLDTNLSRRFFVTSPHSSGVINDLRKKISDHHILNFNNPRGELAIPENSTIIVTGFEQDLTDVAHNQKKIEFFNQYISYDGCIIVRSAVEIDFLFSQYDKLIADPNFSKDHAQLIHQRSQWHDIFRNYIQIHFPMYGNATCESPEEIEKVLYRVLGGSHFLWKLKEQVKNKIVTVHKSLPTGRKLYEKVVIQTQLYANSYFHELWNQCTDSEKLILFDLAEDGILNGLDKISIKNLYQKGLIRESNEKENKLDYPVIFSESFGNFILESSALDEAKQLEREYKRKGKWSNYSLIFGTFIISLLAFFIIAEPHYLDRVNSIIAASTAAIPLLVQLSKGLFSFNFSRGAISN